MKRDILSFLLAFCDDKDDDFSCCNSLESTIFSCHFLPFVIDVDALAG